jgi:hypothetical protein
MSRSLADYLATDHKPGTRIVFGPATNDDDGIWRFEVARHTRRGFVVERFNSDAIRIEWDFVYAFLQLAKLKIRIVQLSKAEFRNHADEQRSTRNDHQASDNAK